jgi:hypothetical protein
MEPEQPPPEQKRQALREKLTRATAARESLKDYDNPQLVESLDAEILQLKRRITQSQPISTQLNSVSECIARRKATISKTESQISDLQDKLLACQLDLSELEQQQVMLQQEAPVALQSPLQQTIFVKDPKEQMEIEKLRFALRLALVGDTQAAQAAMTGEYAAPATPGASILAEVFPPTPGSDFWSDAEGPMSGEHSLPRRGYGPAQQECSAYRSSPLGQDAELPADPNREGP